MKYQQLPFTEGLRVVGRQRSIIYVIFGIIIGFFLSSLISSLTKEEDIYNYYQLFTNITASTADAIIDIGQHSDDELAHTLEDTELADKLYEDVRVLCWIMTSPSNHKTKANAVKNTWGKRCNKLLFMSSQEDLELGSVGLNVSEGRNNLWAKTKEAFKYVYKNHFEDADWFLKADDDTYVIVENLRFLLYPYSPEQPIHFGFKYKIIVKQGYMSGGAGYVLSKEAVRRFVEEAIPDPKKCRADAGGSEDVEIGKCLQNVNVEAGDSRDIEKRGRFFPFILEHHLFPNEDKEFWYWKNMFYETKDGLNCCSDNAVSFHYVKPREMFTMDFLIYHLRPYGIVQHPQLLPEKIPWPNYSNTVSDTPS